MKFLLLNVDACWNKYINGLLFGINLYSSNKKLFKWELKSIIHEYGVDLSTTVKEYCCHTTTIMIIRKILHWTTSNVKKLYLAYTANQCQPKTAI